MSQSFESQGDSFISHWKDVVIATETVIKNFKHNYTLDIIPSSKMDESKNKYDKLTWLEYIKLANTSQANMKNKYNKNNPNKNTWHKTECNIKHNWIFTLSNVDNINTENEKSEVKNWFQTFVRVSLLE